MQYKKNFNILEINLSVHNIILIKSKQNYFQICTKKKVTVMKTPNIISFCRKWEIYDAILICNTVLFR